MTWERSEENRENGLFDLEGVKHVNSTIPQHVSWFATFNGQLSTLNPCLPPGLGQFALVADCKIFHIHAPAPSGYTLIRLPSVIVMLSAGQVSSCPFCLTVMKPKLLFAGRNAVCTDAVCAAAMGYDPTVGHGHFPFPAENHLKWAADAGIGTRDPSRIEVVGLGLNEARYPFRSSPATATKATS